MGSNASNDAHSTELSSLISSSNKNGNENGSNNKSSHKNPSSKTCLWILVALVLLGGGGSFVWLSKPASENDTKSDDDTPTGGLKNNNWSDHSASSSTAVPPPLSRKHPVHDLNLLDVSRPERTRPTKGLIQTTQKSGLFSSSDTPAVPTNEWYQNLLLIQEDEEPSAVHRVYASPYVVDVTGRIPGLSLHHGWLMAGATILQLQVMDDLGLTLGAVSSRQEPAHQKKPPTHTYTIQNMNKLGVTLEWNAYPMRSTIMRGMPFGTMEYDLSGKNLIPTLASPIALRELDTIRIDSDHDDHEKDEYDYTMDQLCSSKSSKPLAVERDVELYTHASDYTWLILVSEPVRMECRIKDDGTSLLHFHPVVDDTTSLIVRLALSNTCTQGHNFNSCSHQSGKRLVEEDLYKHDYGHLLRTHGHLYPGPNARVSYAIDDSSKQLSSATLTFDWDVQSWKQQTSDDDTFEYELLTFALSHHVDQMNESMFPQHHQKVVKYCRSSMTGPVCVVQGNQWNLEEDTLPDISFRAPRPPESSFLPDIAQALKKDMNFTLKSFFQKGVGDTYFSGKMLSKLARILLIAEEVREVCSGSAKQECANHTATPIPTDKKMEDVLDRLMASSEIWVNGSAVTPFVYDAAWGGLVSCGCQFEDDACKNAPPDCPAFSDQGLNFGNGFYNDHHFHYGYHLYAAAVIAQKRPQWGIDHWDEWLLLVRDIANPSSDDPHFPLFRHKDWYQGSSWAMGVVLPPFLNGRNQESSSEAIAAYEAVALFGKTMHSIWSQQSNEKNAAIALDIYHAGLIMTSTEIRSTQKYWHVLRNQTNDASHKKQHRSTTPTSSKKMQEAIAMYPKEYQGNVIGILWSTMAQFGTWFGGAPYLPYGIQLLPLTPISEARDSDYEWVAQMYHPFSRACSNDFQCTSSGWSILQLSVLATIGYKTEAVNRAKQLPSQAFTNAGGNGHSLSNTLWYIATRPTPFHKTIVEPGEYDSKEEETTVPLDAVDIRGDDELRPKPLYFVKDCHIPDTCTAAVLNHTFESTTVIGNSSVVISSTCRDHMNWIIQEHNRTQWEACVTVAEYEYPEVCGACNPNKGGVSEDPNKPDGADGTNDIHFQCPPCSEQVCRSDLNHCPFFPRSFVCTDGMSVGGCSAETWLEEIVHDAPSLPEKVKQQTQTTLLVDGECNSCCELTGCQRLRDTESSKLTQDGNAFDRPKCPPCPRSVCYGGLNQCPVYTAPYLCLKGNSHGGCASVPWQVGEQCSECCEIKVNC